MGIMTEPFFSERRMLRNISGSRWIRLLSPKHQVILDDGGRTYGATFQDIADSGGITPLIDKTMNELQNIFAG